MFSVFAYPALRIGTSTDWSTQSEQNSQVHVILRDLVTENKRLHFDGTQQLERQLQDIQRVILQLQSETKLQKTTLNIMYKAIDNSGPIEASTTTAWADSMKELISKLSSLAEEVEHQASEHTLLRSLYFDGIRTREDQIVPSHKKTFEWLLDPSSQTSFVPWLENESGIYWINGKAGSGKSTLMKYLVTHQQTMNMLKVWAGTKKIVTASFYFWNAEMRCRSLKQDYFDPYCTKCCDHVQT